MVLFLGEPRGSDLRDKERLEKWLEYGKWENCIFTIYCDFSNLSFLKAVEICRISIDNYYINNIILIISRDKRFRLRRKYLSKVTN